MKSDAMEMGRIPAAAACDVQQRRLVRPSTRRGVATASSDTASPAAVDEVFAALARRLDRIESFDLHAHESPPQIPHRKSKHSATSGRPETSIGTIPSRADVPVHDSIDSASRCSLNVEMERQRTRLAQLLEAIGDDSEV